MKQIKILLNSKVPPGVLKSIPGGKYKVYWAHPDTVQLIGMKARGDLSDENITEVMFELVKKKKLILK